MKDIAKMNRVVSTKLGYGRYSTVWLVKDQRRDDCVTVILMGHSLIIIATMKDIAKMNRVVSTEPVKVIVFFRTVTSHH
jgi:hypothetical protein